MRRVKATIIILLIITYVCLYQSELDVIQKLLPVWIHAIYMFIHASALHLLCNCYALWFVLNDRVLKPALLIPLVYIIAVISSLIATNSNIIVGASAVVYAAVGVNMYGNRSAKAWLIIGVAIGIGYFMENVSANIHLIAFALGFATINIHKQLQALVNDCRAISRGKQ